METKQKRKYVKKDFVESSVRKAKCGHISKQGRWLNCEDCVPVLPEDNGDWDYFNLGSDELEGLE
jgi:hypothetical protein